MMKCRSPCKSKLCRPIYRIELIATGCNTVLILPAEGDITDPALEGARAFLGALAATAGKRDENNKGITNLDI